MTDATVESASIETVGYEEGRGSLELPTFRFSYQVAGEYYAGRFSLRPPINDERSLLLHMIRRKVRIHYNPENPKAWILHDEMIEGCKVFESDFDGWLARQISR
jgi:hypothetical protein